MDIRQNVDNIRKLSNLVIQELAPQSGLADFGLNKSSIAWVDGFIERERQRTDFTPDSVEGLVNSLGSFLGEALMASTGGEWAWVEQHQTIGIALPGGGYVFPFNKVRKQLVNGRESGDSIIGLYEAVLTLQAAGEL